MERGWVEEVLVDGVEGAGAVFFELLDLFAVGVILDVKARVYILYAIYYIL